MNKKPKISSGERVHLSSAMDMSSAPQLQQSKPLIEADAQFDSWAAKAIRNFIFDVGLGPRFLYLTSFKEMLEAVHNKDRVVIPTYESMLQEELKETQQRAMELKQEWKKSGCSVIMDSWKSRCGTKSFISVLVHCSKGMYFLRSIDVSAILEDMDELVSVFSRVVDDVGARNIVQVVRNDASPHMRIAWHYVQKEHDHSFFVPMCADFCINLLLEKIAAFDHISVVLRKAKEITRFIYGNVLAYELVGQYVVGGEILSDSCLKSVAEFITLDRLVSERENLVKMFSSPEWVSSGWCGLGLFERIQSIVKRDDAFWHAAAKVLKVTNPFVSVLYKLESDICPMGILYEAMDSAKEDIELNLGYESESYWLLIDGIWNGYLHSHLHAAGYMLNPRIFYTDQFHRDTEVSDGIAASTIQLGKAHYNPLKASEQLEVYKQKLGYFDTDPAMQQIMEMPQVQWWSTHGARVPDLQTLARRILSQTCFGATRYNIDWSLSEKLHADWPEMTPPEQERFRQREYVHYNRVLAHSAPLLDGSSVKQHDRVTMVLQDWIRAQK